MKTVHFNSTITLPDGTYVSCSIVVPKSAATSDTMEMAEIAQMGASHAAGTIRRSVVRRNEKVPF